MGGQLEPHVTVHRRDAEQFGVATGEQNRNGVVVAGVAVEDDFGFGHGEKWGGRGEEVGGKSFGFTPLLPNSPLPYLIEHPLVGVGAGALELFFVRHDHR